MVMKRKTKDRLLNGITYVSAFIAVSVLAMILIYLLKTGISSINWHLISSNYAVSTMNAQVTELSDETFDCSNYAESACSSRYGVVFSDSTNVNKKAIIQVESIDLDSPLLNMQSLIAGDNNKTVSLSEGSSIASLYYLDNEGNQQFLSKEKMKDAATLVSYLDDPNNTLTSISYQTMGGGIRGSIVVTFMLIIISMCFAIPVGILAAIYLNEYAPKNKFSALIRQGINTLTGIPSIIYGLMGVTVLFPITALMGAKSTSVLLGGMTLAIILLPTIIANTEEALKTVPQALKDGSLSLGATKTQTIIKVVLPCALNGILTGVLLGIGRVIGESAALVYTTSTVIVDNPSFLSQGTSLSLMIYSIMSGEQPNYQLASAISLIILALVLVINLCVKTMIKRYQVR